MYLQELGYFDLQKALLENCKALLHNAAFLKLQRLKVIVQRDVIWLFFYFEESYYYQYWQPSCLQLLEVTTA